MTENIQNIIFDLGGVIVDFAKDKWIDAFHSLGFSNFEEMMKDQDTKSVFNQFELGLISSEQFCKTIKYYCNPRTTEKEVEDAWNMLLAGIPRHRLSKLLSLRDHYVVYLVSNTNVLHWNHTKDNYFNYHGFTIKDYFESMFLSFEMNQKKPEAGIYHSILARTGIMPYNTLYLDDIEENCATAAKLGFKTHLVTPDEDWTELFPEPSVVY